MYADHFDKKLSATLRFNHSSSNSFASFNLRFYRRPRCNPHSSTTSTTRHDESMRNQDRCTRNEKSRTTVLVSHLYVNFSLSYNVLKMSPPRSMFMRAGARVIYYVICYVIALCNARQPVS